MPIYNYKCPQCGCEFEQIVVHYNTEEKQPCVKCSTPSEFYLPLGSRNGVRFLFNYMAPTD